MQDRILVAYGSKRGGTAELAQHVADALHARGFAVDCKRARDVDDVTRYHTVIAGGALYMNRWVREARRFIARHAQALRARRVWLFSSGPLDDRALHEDIAPPKSLAKLAARVGARGHITFGGRLTPDARGFPANVMAKNHAGDWRDWDQVTKWADSIGHALDANPRPVIPEVAEPSSWPLVALCLTVAATAIGGGIALIAAPDGAIVHMTTAALAHSPFASFLVPGLLLLGVIGLGHLAAAMATLRRDPHADQLAFAAGLALAVWTTTELVMLRAFHVLQPVYLAVALAIMILAMRRYRTAPMPMPQ